MSANNSSEVGNLIISLCSLIISVADPGFARLGGGAGKSKVGGGGHQPLICPIVTENCMNIFEDILAERGVCPPRPQDPSII